jgi:putative hydrolase
MASDGVEPTGMADSGDDGQLRELMRQLFGDRGDEVLGHMRERGMDPAAMLSEGGKLPDPATVKAAMAQVRNLIATSGDNPVNTRLAHDMARRHAVEGGDPFLSGADAKQVVDAFQTAELWLDVATDLPPAGGTVNAWSKSQWVEATLPTWLELMDPVATSMANALASVLGGDREGDDGDGAVGSGDLGMSMGFGDDDGVGGGSDLGAFGASGIDLGQLGLGGLNAGDVMRKVGAAAFGLQVGQAAGTLSREVFGITDVGLPLVAEPGTALLPTNVAAFAEGLDVPLSEVRLFLAVREAAHARLFAHVPWVRPHLLGLVERYARDITIDLDALEDQVRGIDASDPAGLQRALSGGGLYGMHATPEQEATLLRLETALALVEGWVDEVTAQATLPHLPNAVPLREMIQRRRASGGPAEQTFAALVGLDLRPRRSREAGALMRHIYTAGGVEGRDGVWSHPDLLPGPIDLDDPAGYLARRQAQDIADHDIDAFLSELLSDGGPGSATDSGDSAEGPTTG